MIRTPWLEGILACPLCGGGIAASAAEVMQCTDCLAIWQQSLPDVLDLMPPDFEPDDRTKWRDRQSLMLQWYRTALDDDSARSGLVRDYELLAPLLASLSGRVLDLGGGLGMAQQFLPRACEYAVLDPSANWLDLPTSELHAALPALSTKPAFIRGVGERLPFRCGSFDHVLALWVLNHVSRPDRVLVEAHRVLKPGGRLLLVLEDMPPAERDHPRKHPREAVAPTDPNPLPIQDDHIAFTESDLWRWAAGRFTVASREWRNRYLTFEFVSTETPHAPIARSTVHLGDLRRLQPVSTQFGFDRGLPVDRHYIEAFLARNAAAVRGCVLEIGDDSYTWRYGAGRVETSDVLHVSADNPRATVIADLADPSQVPQERYDCIICTQTLHLIYDIRAAVVALHRMLKPGGVLLATAPGISQISNDRWRDTWYWSLTPLAAKRLFAETFGSGGVEIGEHGNVLAAIAFLHGLAADELDTQELETHDPSYPVLVTIKATKPVDSRMSLLQVVEVVQGQSDPQIIDGMHLDLPCAGDRAEAGALRVQGWVVGHAAPAIQVEILVDGNVRGRILLGVDRPDVAAHLPKSAWSAASGFTGTVDLLGIPVSEVCVHAVFADDRRVLIGTIAVTRVWLEPTHPAEHDVVSVVIPCFNQAHYLGEAIESVISQSYPKIEVVVVDDGSLDNTVEVAARYAGVKYVRQDNRGLAAARNFGLRRSNGQFVVFLDADDRLQPEAIAINLSALQARPECAFVYGEFRHVGVDGRMQEEWTRPVVTGDAYCALLRGNHIDMHATVMYRRAVFHTVRAFDESLAACEDYDLYLRIARVFPIHGHTQLVADYRRHSASISADFVKMLRTSLTVLRSQRKFVRDDPARRAAYKHGLRAWRAYYGRRIVVQARANFQQRRGRLTALRALLAMVRYAPGELLAARRDIRAHPEPPARKS